MTTDERAKLRQSWERLVRSYTSGYSELAIATITDRLTAAKPGSTCVWHEVARWHVENDTRPRCVICGEKCSRLGPGGVHELCRILKAKGHEIRPLVEKPRCGCARCGEFYKA